MFTGLSSRSRHIVQGHLINGTYRLGDEKYQKKGTGTVYTGTLRHGIVEKGSTILPIFSSSILNFGGSRSSTYL
jgi:hypothetical protein